MFFEARGDLNKHELNTSLVNEEKEFIRIDASETSTLLDVMKQIQTRSTQAIQVILNEYLVKETSAGLSFIICPRKLTSDYIIVCIGKIVVEPPIFVKDEWKAFKKVLDKSGIEPTAFKADCMDERFDELISTQIFERTGQVFTNFLIIPCCLPSSVKPQLYVVLVNTGENSHDLSRDWSLVGECMRYCTATLRNTMVAEEMKENHEKLKIIISGVDDTAKNIANDRELVIGIKRAMERVLDSTVSSIFLKEGAFLVSKSYNHGYPLNLENELQLNDIKIPLGIGLTGLAGTLGEVFVSNDPNGEKVYCNVPSTATEFRNVLSFPFIFKNKIIAVGEVYNKTAGSYVEIDKLNALLVGTMFAPILKKAMDLRKNYSVDAIKGIVSSQLGTKRGIRPDDEHEVNRVKLLYKTVAIEEFGNLDFLPPTVPLEESIAVVIGALNHLHLLDELDVRIDELIRFMIYQKNHQKSFPFRNWLHSFSAFQFLYSIFVNFGLMNELGVTPLEALAMFLAVLCNGCEYLGPTHRFQSETGTVLASVYSSPGCRSEHFAIQQSLETMMNPEFDFLVNLSPDKFKEFLHLFEDMILSTDLVNFAENKEELQKLMAETKSNVTIADDQKTKLINILMICSKLSDHARPWEHASEMGKRLCREFYRYPEIKSSTRLFPRAVSDSPFIRAKLHSQIIRELCIPAFQMLKTVLPAVQDYIQNLNDNLKKLNSMTKQLEREEWSKKGEERGDSHSINDD